MPSNVLMIELICLACFGSAFLLAAAARGVVGCFSSFYFLSVVFFFGGEACFCGEVASISTDLMTMLAVSFSFISTAYCSSFCSSVSDCTLSAKLLLPRSAPSLDRIYSISC